MNTLRRKLQFQLIQNGGKKIIVIQPISNPIQLIQTDEEFYCEVELPQNIEADFVEVRFNQYLLGTLEVASNNIASGYITIPNRLVGYGTTFIIENEEEVPVNDTIKQTLNFAVQKLKGKVVIELTANKDFVFGDANGKADVLQNENVYDFGFTITEVDNLQNMDSHDIFNYGNVSIEVIARDEYFEIGEN